MAVQVTLYIDQGAHFTAEVTLTNYDSTPLDLTGFTVRGQMRRSYYSRTSTVFTAAVSNAAAGLITISLTDTQTAALKPGRYVYDVEIVGPSAVSRAVEGIVVVSPEVTRA